MKNRIFYSSSSYRFGFQGQEYDNETKGEHLSLNYKFRMYDPRLGKFLSLDPLSSKFPWNSPFVFCENRVIDARELEGKEAFFVHGTHGSTSAWNDYVRDNIRETFGNQKLANPDNELISWSGHNNSKAREDAAKLIVERVQANRVEGEAITIIGHSHGGNASILAVKELKKLYPDAEINLVLLNTVSTNQYQFSPEEMEGINVYDVYNPNDAVVPKAGHSKTGRKEKGGNIKIGVFPIGGERSRPGDSFEEGGGTMGHLNVPGDNIITYESVNQGNWARLLTGAFKIGNVQVQIAHSGKLGSRLIDIISGHRGWHEENAAIWLPKLKEAVNSTKNKNSDGGAAPQGSGK